MRWCWLFSLLLAVSAAHGRVFSYREASVAPYFRGTGGLSTLGSEAFKNSSGTDTALDGGSQFTYSGEVGVLFPLSSTVNLRLGAEVLQHNRVNTEGYRPAGGNKRFDLESSSLIFIPSATLEFVFQSRGPFRTLFEIGAGWADVTIKNDYMMTVDGTADLGVNSFTEKLGATGWSTHVALGMEALFTDNVTLLGQAGYRYLPVKNLNYKSAVQNIVEPGGVGKGDSVLNHSGDERNFDLGGFFIGLSFRFYLRFL